MYRTETKEIGRNHVGVLSTVTRVGKSMIKTQIMKSYRLVERFTNQLTDIALHCGLGQSEESTNQWNDLKLMTAKDGASILDHANKLRKLSVPDLWSRAKIDKLSKKFASSVFTCWNMEMRHMGSGDTVRIVSYDTFITNAVGDLENKRGKIFRPIRYADELQAAECSIVVYKGIRKSKVGRDYYNLNITAMPAFTLSTQSDEELANAIFGGNIPPATDASSF